MQTYAIIGVMVHTGVMRKHTARANESKAINVGALQIFPIFHAASCFMRFLCVTCSNLVRIAARKNRLSLLADN
jgi:hypothetical protein